MSAAGLARRALRPDALAALAVAGAVVVVVAGLVPRDGLPGSTGFPSGFSYQEPDGAEHARWMTSEEGVAEAEAPEAGRYFLRLRMSSYERPRTVTVRLDGRRVGQVRVPPTQAEIYLLPVGRLAPGTHEVRLRAVPGPEEVAGADPRAVAVRVGDPVRLRPAP